MTKLIKNPEIPYAIFINPESTNNRIGSFPILSTICIPNAADIKIAVKKGTEYMQNIIPQTIPSAFNKADLSKSNNL